MLIFNLFVMKNRDCVLLNWVPSSILVWARELAFLCSGYVNRVSGEKCMFEKKNRSSRFNPPPSPAEGSQMEIAVKHQY